MTARCVGAEGRAVATRGGWFHTRVARVALVAGVVAAFVLALGAASAQASLYSPVQTFGSQGSGAGQFQTPVGAAVQASSGNVYVADSGNARVDVFGPTGNFIAAWGYGVADGKARSEVCTANCQAGIPGSGPGQFSRPTSVAVGAPGTPSGNKVFIGDAGNAVVEKFDDSGGFMSTIDGTTTPQGHFSTVAGVAVDQNGNLWVADGNTDNITQFTPTGAFVQQWNDTYGSTLAIQVDSTHGKVYLIRGAQTTESWTLNGKNETVIDNGSGVAIALDAGTGNLYVDHGGDVAIYDSAAVKIDSLSLGSTTSSQGLAFSSLLGSSAKPGQGDLYVSDASNNNVTTYAPPSTPAAPLITQEVGLQTGKTTATLNATVVPMGSSTTCTFQYVDDATFQASGYANATSVPCTPASLGSSFTYQEVSAPLTGLTSGATYHFRVVATNSTGTSTGADQTFTEVFAWAPFDRCPVDDPAMTGTDGVNTISLCIASASTGGSIKIGNTTETTGNSNLQFGSILNESNSTFSVVAPPAGALVEASVTIPNTPVGTVTAVTTSAGAPSNFNLFAGISLDEPIVTIPIKIQLENATLGPSCFLGSDQNPILLNPENTDLSNAKASFFAFDPNGVPDPSGPLDTIQVTGLVQGDSTFAVPGAQGCGPNGDGSLDAAVNAVLGLPSPSGSNNLVLDNASSDLVLPTNFGVTGQQFATWWHEGFGS